MNQAEEDALVNEIFDKSWRTEPGAQTSLFNMSESIRLAIRAAVAAERERCAKVADNHAKRDFTWGSENSDRYHAQADWAANIAAAIRRGS